MKGFFLYFNQFPATYFESSKECFRRQARDFKIGLKLKLYSQLASGKWRITGYDCPVIIDLTFYTHRTFPPSNYTQIARYIIEALAFKDVIPDQSTSVINEIRIHIKEIPKKHYEGCFVRFFKNSKPDLPHFPIQKVTKK